MSLKRNDFFPYDDDTTSESDGVDSEGEDLRTEAKAKDEEKIIREEEELAEVEGIGDDDNTGGKDDHIVIIASDDDDDDDRTDVNRHFEEPRDVRSPVKESGPPAKVPPAVKESGPPTKVPPLVPEKRSTWGETSIRIQREFYLLLGIMIETAVGLPTKVELLDHDGTQARVRYLKKKKEGGYGKEEEPEESEVIVALYGLMGCWENGPIKIGRDKLDFLTSTDFGADQLELYRTSGLTFRSKEGLSGCGVICPRDGKLHGAATVEGGLEAMKKILEEEILSESFCLESSWVDLLESPQWSDLLRSSERGKKLLVNTLDDKGGKRKLAIVGSPDDVRDFRKEAGEFFKDNSNVSLRIPVKGESVAKFLKRHCSDLSGGTPGTAKVTFGRDHVEVSGISFRVNAMEKVVKEFVAGLETFDFEETRPGLSAKLFKKKDGFAWNLMTELEDLHTCAIWVTDKTRPAPAGEK